MIKLFNYLLIANVFLGSFILSSSPFDFYVGYIFIISFLFIYIIHYHNISMNSNFLVILMALTVFSLVNVYLENNTLFLMAKQVFGILITGSAYYLLIKINKYEIHNLFRIYLRIALIVAAIGIFQELSYLAGFERGYNYKYIITHWNFAVTGFGMLKVNSILPESAVFAATMAPALFVSLVSIHRNNSRYLNKKGSILIIISYILTFSAVAYVAILVSLMLVFYSSRKIIYSALVSIIIFIFVFISYSYIPDISQRIDDTLGIAMGSSEIGNVNVSTFAFASNAFVSYKSFIDSPLFGHGLGSHPISYDKYNVDGSGYFFREDLIGINKEDANSIFFRLASETGLFGLLVVLYFIFKFYLKNHNNNYLQIVSNSIFIMFMTALLRQGHYFFNGLFFFVWLYYFAYIIHNDKLCRDSRVLN